jgi:hypothetical protein
MKHPFLGLVSFLISLFPYFCINTSYSLSPLCRQDLLRLLGQTSLCAIGEITLSEPLTGLDNLDDVDRLLEQHDGS